MPYACSRLRIATVRRRGTVIHVGVLCLDAYACLTWGFADLLSNEPVTR